jgi:hypothetical protein
MSLRVGLMFGVGIYAQGLEFGAGKHFRATRSSRRPELTTLNDSHMIYLFLFMRIRGDMPPYFADGVLALHPSFRLDPSIWGRTPCNTTALQRK